MEIIVKPHPLFDKGKGGNIIGTATGRRYDNFLELIVNEPITMIKYPKRKENNPVAVRGMTAP